MKTRLLIIIGVALTFTSLPSSQSFSETQHTTEITKFLCGGLALDGMPNSLEEQEWVKTTLEKCVERGLITQENIEMIRNSGGHLTREIYALFRVTNGDIDKIAQLVNHPNYPINVFGSPYEQISIGIEPENVLCMDGLELHLKSHGSPICIKESTFEELVKRGYPFSEKDATVEAENLWKSTSDWNAMKLVRNNDDLYCNSANEELSDKCYSLDEIVFGNGNKMKETGWKLYPGGVGWTLPENSTLSPIYKNVGFGVPPLDFTAMLNDKTFVNKCESNGGIWNYTYHDCEDLWNVCQDVDGIIIKEDITPSCTDTGVIDDDPLTIKVCRDAEIIRVSCVFEY